ncbi:glycosyltransferase [Thermostilla marina]
MTPLRLVLITRRFWPLVGGAERVTANLAAGFRDAGCRVQIVTARWEPHWPQQVRCRDVPVLRLPQPQRRVWGTLRYMRALRAWLKRHRGEYDLVYVSMLKHDAYAALGAVGKHVPVVLRAEGGGETGDCAWHRRGVGGTLIAARCRRAPLVIAPSDPIAEELLASGFSPSKVCVIPNGVSIPQPVTPEVRIAARLAIGRANPRLQIDPLDRLAVYTGRLHPAKGLATLVEAWRILDRRGRAPRLWLVGEGPMERELETAIDAAGLRERIVLAGTFDHVEDVLAAADLFVLPSREEGMSLSLLEAMASGLPVIAGDIPGNHALVAHERTGLLVPVDRPDDWAEAVYRVSADYVLARQLGEQARTKAREYSLKSVVDRHLAKFHELLAGRCPGAA